jgi:hypothetical protein
VFLGNTLFGGGGGEHTLRTWYTFNEHHKGTL